MAVAPLTRRKAQLELLTAACAGESPARVAPRERLSGVSSIDTHLALLERDGVMLHWPSLDVDALAGSGAWVDVFFDHEGERFAFTAESRGRFVRDLGPRANLPLLKLSLPLCVERRQQRAHFRLSLAELEPVHAQLAGMFAPDTRIAVRLTEISTGGMAGHIDSPAASHLQTGDLFWARFQLPGHAEQSELAVRVTNTRVAASESAATVGLAYCPGEDPVNANIALQRLERFVARQEQRHLDRRTQRRGR
ncbi:MAG: hypothetical protein KKB50_05215 [Planctomycetes bacterium]|nr:hypothetical protein [Planctomycetota bacterium]